MDKNEFIRKMQEKLNKIDLNISERQMDEFYLYMKLLIEWNEKINLTAIIEPNEIILKHFVDCATILPLVGENRKVLDMGTGAGFPGIPLKILKKEIDITLVDSLNKRIQYLDEVINELKLEDIHTIHSRAEDLARNKIYREKFDVVVSRAVANLSTLLEYTLPFVRVGGQCICMKGPNVEEEITNAEKALNILGGTIKNTISLTLPDSDNQRTIIVIEKNKSTPNQYPRKAGKPSKEPIS